jgi:hypothetical protein
VQRNGDGSLLAALRLPLLKHDCAIVDMLWAEFNCISTTGGGAEQEFDGDTRHCPAWMCSLVLLDVVLRPGAVAGALDLQAGDAERRNIRPSATAQRDIARSVLRRLRCANGVPAFSLTMRCVCSRVSIMTRWLFATVR